jgi:hypothetical protein
MTAGFSYGRVFLMAYEKRLDVLLAYARLDVFLAHAPLEVYSRRIL